MIFPAFLLVIAALALTLTPQLQHAALTAARTMANTYAYQARVLDAKYIPNDAAPETNSPLRPTLISSLSAMTAGLLLAGWALSPAWPTRHRAIAPARAYMRALHSLHSGHVGDYVAFLTFGAAAFGIILGLLIHRFGM
jgi:multicomponent Na+:H+ antiporter subunit D